MDARKNKQRRQQQNEYYTLKEIERLVEQLNYETVKIEIVMPHDKVLMLEKTKHRPIGFDVSGKPGSRAAGNSSQYKGQHLDRLPKGATARVALEGKQTTTQLKRRLLRVSSLSINLYHAGGTQ